MTWRAAGSGRATEARRLVAEHAERRAAGSRRPVVVGDNSIIEVKLSAGTESVFLTLDGQKGIPLQATDRVRVSRAQQLLKLIQTPNKSYFEILRNKLKWGEA